MFFWEGGVVVVHDRQMNATVWHMSLSLHVAACKARLRTNVHCPLKKMLLIWCNEEKTNFLSLNENNFQIIKDKFFSAHQRQCSSFPRLPYQPNIASTFYLQLHATKFFAERKETSGLSILECAYLPIFNSIKNKNQCHFHEMFVALGCSEKKGVANVKIPFAARFIWSSEERNGWAHTITTFEKLWAVVLHWTLSTLEQREVSKWRFWRFGCINDSPKGKRKNKPRFQKNRTWFQEKKGDPRSRS